MTAMEDHKIVDLYWARSEDAIKETALKYGSMLNRISYSLLSSAEDAEECVNDTYLEAWNRIPEDRPAYLGAYLAKIVRCLSVDRFRSTHRQKRGGVETVCEELLDCIPDTETPQGELDSRLIRDTLNRFLSDLDEVPRRVFVRRYFYSDSISDVAKLVGWSIPRVKTTLFRMRKQLKDLLEQEEIPL